MANHPSCDNPNWKVGFAAGAYGSVNVRSRPDINSDIVNVLRPYERKIVEWNEQAAEDVDWYPVRIHIESAVSVIEGWVHSGYAVFYEVALCKPASSSGLPNKFIDLPLPGSPTIALNDKDRRNMSHYFKWLASVIENGPFEMTKGDADFDRLLAAITQLETTIRLSQAMPRQEPSPQE